jgi:hypothetical protein
VDQKRLAEVAALIAAQNMTLPIEAAYERAKEIVAQEELRQAAADYEAATAEQQKADDAARAARWQAFETGQPSDGPSSAELIQSWKDENGTEAGW